jgi:tetratricopeptide (TPR) repeat protein
MICGMPGIASSCFIGARGVLGRGRGRAAIVQPAQGRHKQDRQAAARERDQEEGMPTPINRQYRQNDPGEQAAGGERRLPDRHDHPNFARGWFISGVIGLWAGDADRAVAHVETALRLSPRDRLGGHYHVLGAANFFKRRYAEAEAKLLLWMQDHPHHPNSHRFLAACYAHMGRLDEARAVVERLRGITAELTTAASWFRNAEQRQLLLAGLRLALGETNADAAETRVEPIPFCLGNDRRNPLI